MRGIPGRVAANFVWVAAFSVVTVLGALLTFAAGVVFDDSYRVRVPMPEAGGVLPDQEVTVLGRAVGVVEDVAVTAEGVELTLAIDGSRSVPSEAVVQVLRRSPIGEQAVDFQPLEAGWTPAEPSSTIEPEEAVVPAEVPVLLEKTVELFEAIQPEDVGTVFAELGDALRDRGQRLVGLNRDALALNETLVAGIPEFDRAIDSSQVVLAELREHREALASSFTSSADLAGILDEQSPTISTLLDTGTQALGEADALIRNERADLGCLMRDLTSVNDMLLGPSTFEGRRELYSSKLDELESALQRHRFFFHQGVPLIAQPDPTTGLAWQRIQFEDPLTPTTAMPYDEARPTPATRPGAACRSPAFGPGVDAVRQDDPVPPHSTSPGIDYAPQVSGQGDRVEPSHDSAGGGGPQRQTLAAPATETPATGGGALLLACAALGLALWLRRRS